MPEMKTTSPAPKKQKTAKPTVHAHSHPMTEGVIWKQIMLFFFPILIGVVVLLFSPTLPAGTLIFVTIVASIGGALVFMKLKWV